MMQKEEKNDSVSCHCKNVTQRMEVQKFVATMQNYTVYMCANHRTNKFDEVYIVNILNVFNHLLQHHDNDHDFEFISQQLSKCDLEVCKIIRRHRRNRNYLETDTEVMKIYESRTTENVSVQQILDKIHCYLFHSYDIGYRLTGKERNKLISDDNTIKLKMLQSMIQKKKKLFEALTDLNNTIGRNKFNCNIEENESLTHYSYGFSLYYWPYYKHINKKDGDKHYVPPKYTNLKEELLQNPILRMGICQFRNEWKKACIHQQTNYAKTISPDIDSYGVHSIHSPSHLSNWGLNKSSKLLPKYLLSIQIYCGFDELQNKFSATLRKEDESEKISDVIKRNSNFHFFGKLLAETVNIFGMTQHQNKGKKIKTFYHGINKTMLFVSAAPSIHGVFSTTSSFAVAVNFSTNGLILELNADPGLKYFECNWVSAFSHELELLFSSGYAAFRLANITDICLGKEYRKDVKAISILDTMITAQFFDDDPSVYSKLLTTNHWNPSLVGAKKLNPQYATRIKQLIKNELSTDNELKIENEYINNMFHTICEKKKKKKIDWEQMNVEMAPKYTKGGYIGYAFLKNIFFKNECIDLSFINSLYPNLRIVQLQNLSKIQEPTLENILNFLSNNTETRINEINLIFSKVISTSILTEMEQTIDHYTLKFQRIQFTIQHKKFVHGAPAIEIKNKTAQPNCCKVNKCIGINHQKKL